MSHTPMKLALDALQVELQNYDGPVPHIDCAITALREALAQPQQEPVATFKDTVLGCFGAAFAEGLQEALEETQDARLRDLVERRLMHALYAAQDTSPPAREPLIDEEAKDCLPKAPSTGKPQVWFTVGDAIKAIRNAEAAHGIKETK